jgi:phosphate/phosphite/phosphonate ABC transporter binding protein
MLKRTLALAVGLTLSVCTLLAHAADTLKVSAIPDEAPTELLRKFKPLGAYLEQQLGMKVEFVPVSDYPAVVEALATDRIDLAWLGGFTFVQARLKPATQYHWYSVSRTPSSPANSSPPTRPSNPWPISRARALPLVRCLRPRAA